MERLLEVNMRGSDVRWTSWYGAFLEAKIVEHDGARFRILAANMREALQEWTPEDRSPVYEFFLRAVEL